MAEEIIVRISGLIGKETSDTDNGEKKPEEEKNALAGGFKTLSKMLHPVSSLTTHTSKEGAMVYGMKELGDKAYDMVSTMVTNSVNRYYQLSEDYIGQNQLGMIKQNIGMAKSMAGSVLSGATAGATFGGVPGMIAGAVISGAATGVNLYQNYQQKLFNYYNSMNAININTNFSARRAGLYTGGKDTLG